MAKKKKDKTDQTEQADQTDLAERNPLASEAGREWLAEELAQAERTEQHGPGGMGWDYNEVLRPAITERAEFLRALAALLESSLNPQP